MGEHMHAATEFAHERLSVRELHRPSRSMADMRDRQARARTLGFEVANERAAGGGHRLAEQRDVFALIKRDAPAVVDVARLAAMRGQGVQRERQPGRLRSRQGQ